MKNLQKGSTVVVLLTIIVIILLGVIGYTYWKTSQFAQPVDTNTSSTQEQVSNQETKTLETSDFSVMYSIKIFSQVSLNETLPPKYDVNYSGQKLISASRAQMIGKNQCSYGESEIKAVCTAEKEGGISFVIVNNSVQNLTSGLDQSLKTNTTLAGKQSIVWKIGAEGEGSDFYYVPIGQNRTLVVTRLYRYDGFPTNTQFNDVISSLKLK